MPPKEVPEEVPEEVSAARPRDSQGGCDRRRGAHHRRWPWSSTACCQPRRNTPHLPR